MRVSKRGNRGYEPIHFEKIATRIEALADGLDVDVPMIAQGTIASLFDGICTSEVDVISASIAQSKSLDKPDYGKLSSRIAVSNMHKSTPGTFSGSLEEIQSFHGFINPAVMKFVRENASALNEMIDHSRDYQYDYFGLITVANTYLVKAEKPVLNTLGEPVYLDRSGKIAVPSSTMQTPDGRTVARMREPNGTIVLLQPKLQEILIDRPQYMHMRVAIAVGGRVSIARGESSPEYAHESRNVVDVLADIKEQYDDLSQMYYTHATPTCLNACRNMQQLNSCFLLPDADDEKQIMKIAGDSATISKSGGGIGIHKQTIRASGQIIKSTGGKASGVVPQIKILNEVANTFNQGGKRKGAVATYLAIWHADLMQFLELRLNHGSEDKRARDIFLALWVSDLFRVRWATGGMWSLMSPDTAPALVDLYDGMYVCKNTGYCANPSYAKWFGEGMPLYEARPIVPTGATGQSLVRVDAFTAAYEYYEKYGYAIMEISPKEIIDAIIRSQRETGMPYVMSADSVNCSSTYRGVGTITGSNLCTEIVEWCSPDSYACCTLASMNLTKFVVDGAFDHEAFHAMCRRAARNLDNVIEVGTYPVVECRKNAEQFRPIALGVQGLANVFAKLRIPFDSAEAAKIELEIFETMYHAAVKESAYLAHERGSHSAFESSPAAAGLLAPDLWLQNQERLSVLGAKLVAAGPLPGDTPGYLKDRYSLLFSDRYDWKHLRLFASTGQRNIALIAPMPTATTSSVMGNVECFEPFGDNIHSRVTQHGKFLISNKEMINHLMERGLWCEKLKMQIINNRGSLAGLGLPDDITKLYKTVSEISQALIIERAALRGAFVDQSQSMNITMRSTSPAVFRGVMWKGFATGVKTCSYYTRSAPAVDAMKNNITASAALGLGTSAHAQTANSAEPVVEGPVCMMEDGCLSCGS